MWCVGDTEACVLESCLTNNHQRDSIFVSAQCFGKVELIDDCTMY